MVLEIEPILDLVSEINTEIDYANNKYYKAKYNDYELIIAYSNVIIVLIPCQYFDLKYADVGIVLPILADS
jgi:hypothetical protein